MYCQVVRNLPCGEQAGSGKHAVQEKRLESRKGWFVKPKQTKTMSDLR